MEGKPALIDDPFAKYLFDNFRGDGHTFLQNMLNCCENLEILTKLVVILMDDLSLYRKGCLIPSICEKSIEISNKFERKRSLDQLKQRSQELAEALNHEKEQYERNMAFKKKEVDFTRKCENSQFFYDNKMSEYLKQIKQLENHLINIGFCEEISEESIQALVEDNDRLKNQIKEVDNKLASYTFEPDEESLKKAIHDLKNEIEIMNEDLEKVIETI